MLFSLSFAMRSCGPDLGWVFSLQMIQLRKMPHRCAQLPGFTLVPDIKNTEEVFKMVLTYNFGSTYMGSFTWLLFGCWFRCLLSSSSKGLTKLLSWKPACTYPKAVTWFHCFRDYLLPPESQPLHEVVYFSAANTLREHLNAAPRIALHTALNNPYYYLKVRRKPTPPVMLKP